MSDATRSDELTALTRILKNAENSLRAIRLVIIDEILNPPGQPFEQRPTAAPANHPLTTHQPTKTKTS